MRFRYLFMGFGSALVLSALLFSDPDKGMATGFLVLGLATPVLAVAFSHAARRGLFDYIDLQRVVDKAMESPQGAGKVFIGVCIVLHGLFGLFGNSARAAVPEQSRQHLPTLALEVSHSWPNTPYPAYFGGLIEHETACTVSAKKCWNPRVQLKTQREQGVGLGQLTRAWRKDGSLRFDALAEMRVQHPALRELSWSNIFDRPDLQLRAVVLKVRSDFSALAAVGDRVERLKFADSAYNGGLGGVMKERRACAMTAGCDPQRWHGHVERTCLKSKVPLYGSRSACDINRHHVHDVFARAPKYLPYLELT